MVRVQGRAQFQLHPGDGVADGDCGGRAGAGILAGALDLERECGALRWRLALTEEQARGLRRITKRDRRYEDGRPHEAVETEALSQVRIVQIVRDRLDALLPEPLSRVHEREERERRALLRRLRSSP